MTVTKYPDPKLSTEGGEVIDTVTRGGQTQLLAGDHLALSTLTDILLELQRINRHLEELSELNIETGEAT